jgi:SARP family transcriptional regulator, regulator of embCAB operon
LTFDNAVAKRAAPAPATFQLLGPVTVFHGGENHTPNALKQRALLALLLLHANQVLPTERIIDELWGDRPPRSAMAAMQTYVTAVRRVLVAPGLRCDPRQHPLLETRAKSYVLHVAPGRLDLDTFRRLAATGRGHLLNGECAHSGEVFRMALEQWRGPAIADLVGTGTLEHYATALEEERMSVLQQRIAVDLCRRRELEVIGPLTELCARYPWREGFLYQLMTAQYLAGRQVEALRTYQVARRNMVTEAGVEPGPALRRMHQAILQGWTPTEGTHLCVLEPNPFSSSRRSP